MWYHVSEPNSYLAITGAGIDKVQIAKKSFVYPFQKVTKIRYASDVDIIIPQVLIFEQHHTVRL